MKMTPKNTSESYSGWSNYDTWNFKLWLDNETSTQGMIYNLIKDAIRYNKKQHQFKDSECGIYSINFVVRLAGGESFDDITNNITKDEKMNLCRETYFRNVVINK